MVSRVKIVFKASTEEYVVRCYGPNGERQPAGDYYTNDKQDAKDTAKLILAIAGRGK